MAPLGMAARHPEQARDGVFGHVDQVDCGSHPAPFAEMVDDGHRLFLRNLRVEQGGATSLEELLTARPTAQEPGCPPAMTQVAPTKVHFWLHCRPPP